MSLNLDARQRAMLLEMGVRVWQPMTVTVQQVAPVAATSSVTDSAAHEAPSPSPPSTDPATRPSGPTRLTELAGGLASMDWPGLTEAVRNCQACAMCLGRRAPVLAAPQVVTLCDWLVVADPPDEAQERGGQPFVGEAGQLLDNMLRAVGVQRWSRVTSPGSGPPAAARAYLTHVLKCRPALMRAPDAAELATCANFLRREIALTQPRVILAMGRFAMQLLLSETPPEQARLPLGKLRGQVWRFADVPLVVTYPPVYLLRNGQHKARAWADLCLARAVASGARSNP